MELGIKLNQRQEQHLLLLPKMLQAIEILQLSTRDLLTMIEHEMSENETLEVADLSRRQNPEPPPPVVERSAPRDDSDDGYEVRARRPDEGDDNMLAQVAARSLSLHGQLLSQLVLLELAPAVREVVSFLIGSLDHNGHLLLQRPELEACLGAEAPIDDALAVLWGLDPPGVGRSGPRESMLAQIDPADPDAPWLAALVSSHLEDLARNRLPQVARSLGVSVEELKILVEKLRYLDPCPGRAFEAPEPGLVQPDVVVRREDGEWQVLVDDSRVPPLRLSPDYQHLADSVGVPRRVRSYLRKKLGSAKDLLAAIEQRRETLGRIASAIVDRQHGFLERGPSGLRPLKMQEIADAVGVHLSTVSRATADKYIQTDFGVFLMRGMFDGEVGGEGQGSRRSVKELLKRLIGEEDRQQPLSDEELVEKLRGEGFDLARRTVAKYRKELGIKSSWQRRDW
jgi:RNA polymerase sigma-54 factor